MGHYLSEMQSRTTCRRCNTSYDICNCPPEGKDSLDRWCVGDGFIVMTGRDYVRTKSDQYMAHHPAAYPTRKVADTSSMMAWYLKDKYDSKEEADKVAIESLKESIARANSNLALLHNKLIELQGPQKRTRKKT